MNAVRSASFAAAILILSLPLVEARGARLEGWELNPTRADCSQGQKCLFHIEFEEHEEEEPMLGRRRSLHQTSANKISFDLEMQQTFTLFSPHVIESLVATDVDIQMRGHVKGVPDSAAALTLQADGLARGRIRIQGMEDMWLESQGPGQVLIFVGDDADASGGNEHPSCGEAMPDSDDDDTGGMSGRKLMANGRAASFGRHGRTVLQALDDEPLCDNSFHLVELAVEADYLYFLEKGSSKEAVFNEIASIVNEVNVQFEEEGSIAFQIVTFILHETEESDPYDPETPFELLQQLRNQWKTVYSNYHKDAVQLFSGRYSSGGTIGYAYVGAMCSKSSVSWVSPEYFQGNNKEMARADLSAHELGHLFDLVHCDCDEPTAYTMNYKIKAANTFKSSNQEKLLSSVNNYQCLTPPGSCPDALCSNYCGMEVSPEEFIGCYCDDECEANFDCCPDKTATCVSVPPEAPPESGNLQQECEGLVMGDLNDDGLVNITDVVSLISIIVDGLIDDLSPCQTAAADFNSDTSLDITDIIMQIAEVKNSSG